MPKNNKTYMTIKYQDMEDYIQKRIAAFTEAFSIWSEKEFVPEVVKNAPISSGRDPREKYHPVGIVKEGLIVIPMDIPGTPFTIRTLGIKSGEYNKRIEVAIQTLHRGWNVPYRKSPLTRSPGQTPFVFRLKDGDKIRHREYQAAPPTGAAETGDWIKTPIVRQVKQITKNKWIVNAFKSKWPRFTSIAQKSLDKEPHVPVKKIKMEKK